MKELFANACTDMAVVGFLEAVLKNARDDQYAHFLRISREVRISNEDIDSMFEEAISKGKISYYLEYCRKKGEIMFLHEFRIRGIYENFCS